ncbi:sulfotransferase family 2 domain-containing protein [Nocardioides alcanivorans]|uniref:sulfotransferase family 2 domain-containing protein n=1 Tax=Nocardioides alcanivorans TaxID=2897352 RepID=UPI001F2AD66D|nr:sulfotransferase family 2 domain-containing protein [Nocardioides alcanivorans]
MHDDPRGRIDQLTAAANELNRQPRDDVRRSRHKAVVLPDHKIVYVTNLKVACSTLKWMLFDLEGRDESALLRSTKPRPTRSQTIHDHDLWGDTPRLTLRDGQGDPDRGWFVFTVIRDPRPRVWSAWQSKLLAGNPNYLHRGEPDQPWWPRTPETPADVIDDFHRFLAASAKEGRKLHRVGRDGHFRPQSDLLHKPGLTYTGVYDLPDLPVLLADLQQHLDGLGLGPLPPLRRENETPSPPRPRSSPRTPSS